MHPVGPPFLPCGPDPRKPAVQKGRCPQGHPHLQAPRNIEGLAALSRSLIMRCYLPIWPSLQIPETFLSTFLKPLQAHRVLLAIHPAKPQFNHHA